MQALVHLYDLRPAGRAETRFERHRPVAFRARRGRPSRGSISSFFHPLHQHSGKQHPHAGPHAEPHPRGGGASRPAFGFGRIAQSLGGLELQERIQIPDRLHPALFIDHLLHIIGRGNPVDIKIDQFQPVLLKILADPDLQGDRNLFIMVREFENALQRLP